MPVRATAYGLDDAQRQIEGQLERAQRVMRAIAPLVFDYLGTGIREFFRREAGPDGKWPPLSERTIEAKGHQAILIETGALLNSLAGRTARSIRRVTNMSLSYGTRREWAYTHEAGIGLPHRGFMPYGHQVDSFVAHRATENILGLPTGSLGGPQEFEPA